MSFSVETTSDLGRCITCTVDAQTFQKRIDRFVEQQRRSSKMAGFRKGKMPKSFFEKQFRPQIEAKMIPEIIHESFQNALREESLVPVADPKFEITNFKPNEDFSFKADFEIFPEITLKSFADLEVEKPQVKIEAGDIDKMIDKLKDQFGTWHDVERASKKDDRVVFDIVSTVEGEEEQTQKDASLVIGLEGVMPGLAEGLTKKKAGDEVTLDLKYPKDWAKADIAGKKVKMICTIKSVAEKEQPTEEKLAEMFGEEGDIEKFRATITKRMQEELEVSIRSELKEKVLEQMIATHDVTIPGTLLEKEVQAIKADMKRRAGGSVESFPDDEIESEAKRRVVLGLLMNEVIKQHEIKADTKQIQEEIQRIAMNYPNPQEVIKAYTSNRNLLASVERGVLLDSAVDVILKEAKLKDVTRSFEDLMLANAS